MSHAFLTKLAKTNYCEPHPNSMYQTQANKKNLICQKRLNKLIRYLEETGLYNCTTTKV